MLDAFRYLLYTSYYAGIMLDAFRYLLCSKLCWHNRPEPSEESNVDQGTQSPQKKRTKYIDTERIIMDEELSSLEINFAQQLLKEQFPKLNGLVPTLYQDKK